MSQAEFKKRLKAQMVRPENQICSDCPERQPRWASLIKPPPGAPHGSSIMGAFCCLECSGSHRRLGVHISFVRSITLDQWKEAEVLAMENGGNGKVNTIFEARLSVAKPTNSATGPMRERFIRDKYERRKFYDPSAFERVAQIESTREREEVVNGVQRRLATSGSRKPSDAARKRVEERAARNRGGGTAVRSATRSVRTPAPAPAPAPVVDLLDFGNFDSPEATTAVQASVASAPTFGVANAAPAAPPTSNQEPELDLFANMSSGNNPGGGGGVNGQIQQQPGQQQQAAQTVDQSKMTNADIMSMFQSPSAAQQQSAMQPNAFAMGGGGGMSNGMAGGNNMAMMGGQQMNPQQMNPQQMNPQQMNPQQMGMMNNNMNPQQQMGMMNNMQMQNMMGQQQQGMGNNMGGNNMNMGMGGQQGMGNNNMGNMGGGNMAQQLMMQQQMNNNNMMTMQGGGGGMMHQGGNQFGQQSSMMGQAQQQQQGQQQRGGNQFSDFGNFGR